uniref:Uncharacterized protein n=1 Tax=Romanomermis culicivorax TaxID=13658 RepID=A0A915HN26_ROMCU
MTEEKQRLTSAKMHSTMENEKQREKNVRFTVSCLVSDHRSASQENEYLRMKSKFKNSRHAKLRIQHGAVSEQPADQSCEI